MTDVLFDYKYVVHGDIIALLISFVTHCLLRSTYMAKKANLGIFRFANILIGVASISSIVYHYMIFLLRAENVIRIYICRGLCYTTLIIVYICFCVYMKNIVEMDKKLGRWFDIIVYGGGIIFAIIEFVGPFFKIGFYVDENVVLHQNYYTDVFRFAYIYYSIIMASLLIYYRKKFLPKMYRCIWSVIAISVGIMVYQAFFLQTAYTVVSFTFPIMMVLFLFHYNSYKHYFSIKIEKRLSFPSHFSHPLSF